MAALAHSGSAPSPPQQSPFHGCVQQGDLLEIMLQPTDDPNNVTFVPCAVWECTDVGFHVYYLVRCHPHHSQADARSQDQLLHVFESSLNFVPWQSVNLHVPLGEFSGTQAQMQKKAFKKLGIRDLGDGRFYKICEEQLLQSTPSLMRRETEIGVLDSESDEDSIMDSEEEGESEELDENGFLKDLVVPDSEIELFTRAEGTAHSDTMNQAAQQFDTWIPANEAEQRAKDLIDSIDTRVRRAEAARAWGAGRAM